MPPFYSWITVCLPLYTTVYCVSRAQLWDGVASAGLPPLLPRQFTCCAGSRWYALDLLYLHDGRDSALPYVPHPSHCCCFHAASERRKERPDHWLNAPCYTQLKRNVSTALTQPSEFCTPLKYIHQRTMKYNTG